MTEKNNILDSLQKIMQGNAILTNHPARKFSLEDKVLYLRTLTLASAVDDEDGEMHPQEIFFMAVLLSTFKLPQEEMCELQEFTKSFHEKSNTEFLQSFRDAPEKSVPFLLDTLEILHRDGRPVPEKEDFFATLGAMLFTGWEGEKRLEEIRNIYATLEEPQKLLEKGTSPPHKEQLLYLLEFRGMMEGNASCREVFQKLLQELRREAASPGETKKKTLFVGRMHILEGHRGSLNGGSFSPDGTLALTASEDGTARIWDVATGEERSILKEHPEAVFQGIFSEDASQVLTISGDGKPRLWHVASGKVIRILEHHPEERDLHEMMLRSRTIHADVISPHGSRVLILREGIVWLCYGGPPEKSYGKDTMRAALSIPAPSPPMDRRLLPPLRTTPQKFGRPERGKS